jgi:hypothetical protein
MNHLADQYKTFMADVCAKFECSEMYNPLEKGFQCLCEAYYDSEDYPDYDPPDPWDNADRHTIPLHYISGATDGELFELEYDDDDISIKFNVEAWYKLAGVTELVPEDLSEYLEEDEGIEDVGTQYVRSWYSPSQYFEDPGDGGSMYRIEMDVSEQSLTEALTASLDACNCPADIQTKLLAVVPQLVTSLNQFDGYKNDDNW